MKNEIKSEIRLRPIIEPLCYAAASLFVAATVHGSIASVTPNGLTFKVAAHESGPIASDISVSSLAETHRLAAASRAAMREPLILSTERPNLSVGVLQAEKQHSEESVSDAVARTTAYWLGQTALLAKLTTTTEKANAQLLYQIAESDGLSRTNIGYLDDIAATESAFDQNSINSRSGAGGIPQALPESKMASAGADYRTNPATQIAWMIDYVDNAKQYGDAEKAWEHEIEHGWY